MIKKPKSNPKFRSEAEERRFWETHNSCDYIDWTKAERVRFPNLKPSTTAISLRLPVTLLERIKIAANKRSDVPSSATSGSSDCIHTHRRFPGQIDSTPPQ